MAQGGVVVRVVPVVDENLPGPVEPIEPAATGADPQLPLPVFIDLKDLIVCQGARIVGVVAVDLEVVTVKRFKPSAVPTHMKPRLSWRRLRTVLWDNLSSTERRSKCNSGPYVSGPC